MRGGPLLARFKPTAAVVESLLGSSERREDLSGMFGLGYQEFLLLIVATAILLVFAPAVFYLLVWVCLRVLKSPLRVLIALWILDTMVALVGELGNLNIIFVVGVVLLAPSTIAMQFIVLWVAGSIWRLVG